MMREPKEAMDDFEEKDAIVNAGFDGWMEEQKLMIQDEATREIFFEVWKAGMAFMLMQLVKEMS